jgi:nucleoside-specific outer membrane channel protein Tsx
MRLFLIGILSFFALSLGAATFSTANIQYLTGKNYSVGSDSQDLTKKNIVTFEYASAWKYGDNFFFIDLTAPFETSSSDHQELYGEWHPRFSLNRWFNLSEKSLIKNISTAFEMNFGRSSYGATRALLYGLGFDFNLPGFAFFNINIFIRENKDSGKQTFQLSPYWLFPFSIGQQNFEFNGFLDYETADGNRFANYLFSPQLLWDLGNIWGKKGMIYIGLEYNKWHNMYGLEGVNEDRIQFMGRWTL